MIIDGHTHGMHGAYLDQVAVAGGSRTRKGVDSIRRLAALIPQYLDVGLRVEQLERFGIDLQVVTPPTKVDPNMAEDVATKLALARAVNDNMARLQEDSKGRLVAAASVPIGIMEQGGRQEMERAVKTLGLRAVNLPTTINGKPLDSPEYEPFWACAEQMNVAVYTHPEQQPGRANEMKFDLPHTFGWPYETTLMLATLVFSGLMERYPNLNVVSHHLGGGMIPFFMGRVIETNDPTASDESRVIQLPKPLFDYFSRFYYDSAVGGSAAAIKCAYEVFGANQIIFATDAPHGPKKGLGRLETYPQLIKSLGLPEADTEKILSGNVRRILNLR